MKTPLTLPPTRTYGHLLAPPEHPLTLDDRVVHFGLEHFKEARLADLLARLGPLDERTRRLAQLTGCRRHRETGRCRDIVAGVLSGAVSGKNIKLLGARLNSESLRPRAYH